MPDVLEGCLVLKMMGHHGVLRRGVGIPRRGSHIALIVIVVVSLLFAHEVFRAFVFVGSAILHIQVSIGTLIVICGNVRIGIGRWSR